MIYLDDKRIVIDVVCNRKLKKLCGKFFEEKYEDTNIKVQYAIYDKKVHVNCWLNDSLIFSQGMDYIPNQKYVIECKYNDLTNIKHLLNTPIRWDSPSNDLEKEPRNYEEAYFCIKELHPKVAKKWFKQIKKDKLVSKAYWDSYMSYYDWKCKCCDYAWVGNPEVGFVREKNYSNKAHKPIEKILKENGIKVYKGKYYEPCAKEEYDTLDFYNREEWEEYRSKYAPTRKYTTYLNELEYYTKIERLGISNFDDLGFDTKKLGRKPKFEEFAEKWGFDYRVTKEGTNFEIGDILHECQSEEEEACTERVVNFDWPRYKIRFPSFDELWEIPMTQEEIDKNANARGGAFRLKGTNKVFAKDNKTFEEPTVEKVVADMVHSTKPKDKDVVRCPVCDDLNKILCHSGYSGLNIFQRAREQITFKWDFFKRRLNVIISDWKYDRRHKNVKD